MKYLFVALLILLTASAFAGSVMEHTNGQASSTAMSSNTVSLSGVNLNSVNSDNPVSIPYSRYIVRRVVVSNASTTPTLATLAVFTGAGGTGTTVVAAAVLTTLTTTAKFSDRTVALSSDILTASTLYIRNVAANTSALTADVSIEVQPLP